VPVKMWGMGGVLMDMAEVGRCRVVGSGGAAQWGE